MKQAFLLKLKKMFSIVQKDKKFPLADGVLLVLTVFSVFVVPVLPKAYLNLVFTSSLTGIFFFAVLSLKKNHKFLLSSAIFLSMMVWVTLFSESGLLKIVFRVLNFFFFLFLVASLIRQISLTATVTFKVIVDSITGYLLLGYAYGLIVTVLSIRIPGAYNLVPDSSESGLLEPMSNNIYYTFMTFTTTGYGDVVPTDPLSKSLAVLISVSGQLYVAIIIAMLVGKYASTGNQIH